MLYSLSGAGALAHLDKAVRAVSPGKKILVVGGPNSFDAVGGREILETLPGSARLVTVPEMCRTWRPIDMSGLQQRRKRRIAW